MISKTGCKVKSNKDIVEGNTFYIITIASVTTNTELIDDALLILNQIKGVL